MSNNLITFPFTEDISGTTIPSFPGAYVFRDAYNSGSTGMIPIYTSIPNFTANGLTDIMNDKDDTVLVLPGFSLTMYQDTNYGGTTTIIDNIYGTDIMMYPTRISASSCKLFYKNYLGIANEVTTTTITPSPYMAYPTFNTPYPDGSTLTSSDDISKTYSFLIYQTNTNTIYNIPQFNSNTMDYIHIWIIGGGGGGGGTRGLGGNMYESSNGGHSGKSCILVNPNVDIAISNCNIGWQGIRGSPNTNGSPGGFTYCIINGNWISVDGGRGGGKADGLSTSTTGWPWYLGAYTPSIICDQTSPTVNQSIRNMFSEIITYGSNPGVYTQGGHSGVDREGGGNGGNGWTYETISGANTDLYPANTILTATNGVGGLWTHRSNQLSLAGSGAGAGGGGSYAGENGNGNYGGYGAQGLISVIIKYKI